jgi:2-keto-4-pentenoate hydratase/2-oxohepta-3-ene-1,7-dioic acid hydratase in catechol pathway
MESWTYLVRFTAEEDGEPYYTTSDSSLPQAGAKVSSFKSISTLKSEHATRDLIPKTVKEVCIKIPMIPLLTSFKKIISPVEPENPIICIGLNYSNHASEAQVYSPIALSHCLG